MKRNYWILVLSLVISVAWAQERAQPKIAKSITSASARSPGKPLPEKRSRESITNRAADEVGPHSRTWAAANRKPGRNGRAKGRIVEIATGMHFWNGAAWIPSESVFETTPEGFVANRVQHKVRINRQLNVAGAILVTTPDGIPLKSTPVAIALYDAASGDFAVIAGVQDTVGVADGNQVFFENAFDENGVSASVLYTIENGSFEQDVILTSRLNPADYGFPAKTTRIQILTEFYGAPEPDRIRRPLRTETKEAVRAKMKEPDFVDHVLGFGEFVMATGRAYQVGGRDQARAGIAKEFKALGEANRQFLIESLEYPSVEDELKALPAARTAALDLRRRGESKKQYANIPSARPAAEAKATALVPGMEAKTLALAMRNRQGVVIDYIATIGGTVSSATVFEGDTTYFVSAPAIYNGSVTIEGGAIFKFRNSTGTTPAPITTYIKINNTITCKTSQYLPAVFTAMDDDSVGEWIPGSVTDQNGNPVTTGATGILVEPGPDGQYGTGDDIQRYYGSPYLWLYYGSSPSVSNLRFLFGKEAVRVENNFQNNGATISHSQFVQCIKGIVLTGSDGSSGTAVPLTLRNALMAHVDEPFTALTATRANVIQHCTINDSVRIATAVVGASTTFSFANSIVANVPQSVTGPVTLSGNNNGFYNYTGTAFGQTTTRYVSLTDPFVSVGQSGHYLAANSTLRQKGSTGVGATVLNELKKRSTQAPLLVQYPNQLEGENLWAPVVSRYVSGQPDLGYWYDAVDFLTTSIFVADGKLTITGGTVVGHLPDEVFNEWGQPFLGEFGLFIATGGILDCIGTPLMPNRLISSDVVQEYPNPYTPFTDGQIVLTMDGWEDLPGASLRFTEFSVLGGYKSYSLLTGADNAGIWWTTGEIAGLEVQDCVFRSGQVNISQYGATTPGTVLLQNNLFERVYALLYPYSVESSIEVRNNLFKNCTLDVSPGSDPALWVLTDNLFDRSTITMGGGGAVTANYNAYWFSTDPQTRLLPNGVNDKILTAAPPYQSSTLGTYYLPYNTGTSTLFSGSRTPGEAGLYHYTSRTTQVKDGDETEIPNKVNVGLHYVALAAGIPKDTDADGIPDYIEDANGNGVFDTGETSPSMAQTTSGTADSLNVIYDTFDLDGDGLKGLGEKALTKNPVIADNPIRFAQISPGPSADTVRLHIPMNFSSMASIGFFHLRIDGKLASMLRWDTDSNGECVLTWDTTFNVTGPHLVQAELYIDGIGACGSGSVAIANGITTTPPYPYPILPGTLDWEFTDVPDRIFWVQVPQEWQDIATSWQLFCSAVANPYVKGMRVSGNNIANAYAASLDSPCHPVLPTADGDTELGENILRFISATDPTLLEAIQDCYFDAPCMTEFTIICHMGTLDHALTPLNQASLLRLFKLAVWDSDALVERGYLTDATAPIRMMYSLYPRLSPAPNGVSIPPLTDQEKNSLDKGEFPPALDAIIASAKNQLGLSARPQ